MNSEKERLERIALHHIAPPAHHQVDVRIQNWDMKKIYKYVKGPNVLEMGYGDGRWTIENINNFGKTYLLDASENLINHAKEKFGEKVICFNSFFEDFTCPESVKFNTIVASHILEHVYSPVLVLNRAKEWLADDGVLIIVVPNAQSIHRQLAVIMGIQNSIYDFSLSDHEVGHLRVYDIEALKNDVEQAGFSIIYERGLFLKMLPNSMMVNYSDSLLQAMVDISDNLPAYLMANLALIVSPIK